MLLAQVSSSEVELWGPIGIIGLIGATIVAIIGFIQWRKVRIAEMEATLKQQMLDRGMSADEITRVLAATSASSHGLRS
jgi:hypothetical protein